MPPPASSGRSESGSELYELAAVGGVCDAAKQLVGVKLQGLFAWFGYYQLTRLCLTGQATFGSP